MAKPRVARELVNYISEKIALQQRYNPIKEYANRLRELLAELQQVYDIVPAIQMRYQIADFADGKRIDIIGPVNFTVDTDDVDFVSVARKLAAMLAALDERI